MLNKSKRRPAGRRWKIQLVPHAEVGRSGAQLDEVPDEMNAAVGEAGVHAAAVQAAGVCCQLGQLPLEQAMPSVANCVAAADGSVNVGATQHVVGEDRLQFGPLSSPMNPWPHRRWAIRRSWPRCRAVEGRDAGADFADQDRVAGAILDIVDPQRHVGPHHAADQRLFQPDPPPSP